MTSRQSRTHRSLSPVLAAAAALMICGPSPAVAGPPSQAGQPTRVIHLDLVTANPDWIGGSSRRKGPSAAKVKLYTTDNSAIHFTVRGLRQLPDGGAYSLYVISGDDPDDYDPSFPARNARLVFNTDWTGVFQAWLIEPRDLPVEGEPVTAFVVYDPDDGESHATMPDPARIIFQGTAPAP